MFVCHYERKKFVDDHRQKYAEITKICLGNEIADKRLRFLQTKHLQCIYPPSISSIEGGIPFSLKQRQIQAV